MYLVKGSYHVNKVGAPYIDEYVAIAILLLQEKGVG